jgi:hypothetical protein
MSNQYLQYYKRQYGGEIPVFRGGQHGDGLGDWLRGALRWLMPVAFRGLTTFGARAADAHNSGQSMTDAMKTAIRPALSAAAQDALARAQGGSGALFAGDHGVPTASTAAAYKSSGKSHKKKTKKLQLSGIDNY